MHVIEPLFTEKWFCQVVIIPKQAIVPIKRRRDPDGGLVVVDGLFWFALGATYIAKEIVAAADRELIVCVREEINHPQCGFLCSIGLLVEIQQPSKLLPSSCLSRYIVESFVNFQRFCRVLHSFLVEAERLVCIRYKPQRVSDLEIIPPLSPELQGVNEELFGLRVVSDRVK